MVQRKHRTWVLPVAFACWFFGGICLSQCLAAGSPGGCVSVEFAPNEPHKLHGAASFGCVDAARQLIEKGADVNAKDQNGMTPLDVASAMGHVEVVQLLLANGASLKAATGPLQLAAVNGRLSVAKYLLDNNLVDVNDKTKSGKTALDLAQGQKNKPMVDLLLSRGAKPSH